MQLISIIQSLTVISLGDSLRSRFVHELQRDLLFLVGTGTDSGEIDFFLYEKKEHYYT